MLFGYEHFYSVFSNAVSQLADLEIVLDLGTTYRFRKELEPFASSFRAHYFALDYHAQRTFGDRNVDVDADMRALPFANSSVDGIICVEVLEHVTDPQLSVDQMYRVLRQGGYLLLTTPFLQPYHGKPGDYCDFYRYTDEGLRWLLRHFCRVEVYAMGGLPYRLLSTLVPFQLHQAILKSAILMKIFNTVDQRWSTPSPLRWLVWGEK